MKPETELRECPYPETVWLADPHVKQDINGHSQMVGMFITDKPTGGDAWEYTRVRPPVAHEADGITLGRVLDANKTFAEHKMILLADNKRLRDAINWALGETDFRHRMEGEGAYWWRKELQERAYGNTQAQEGI